VIEMKTRELILNISHEHLVQALEQYLSNSVLCPWKDDEVLLDADFGITVNSEGYVPVLLTLEDIGDQFEFDFRDDE